MIERASRPGDQPRIFLAKLESEINAHPALNHSFLRRFGQDVLDRAQLTEFGMAMLARYRAMELKAAQALASDFAEFSKYMAAPPGAEPGEG